MTQIERKGHDLNTRVMAKALLKIEAHANTLMLMSPFFEQADKEYKRLLQQVRIAAEKVMEVRYAAGLSIERA